MIDSEILVVNVRRAVAPLIITCDVHVGDLLIHGVTLRKGRGDATYINLPRQWSAGHWSPAIEITAHDLLVQVRSAVVMAGVEATRYTLA